MSRSTLSMFPPDAEFQAQANVKSADFYDEAEQDPIAFWEKCASDLCWFQKWSCAFSGTFVHPQWFVEGKLNASYNCLDRHLLTETRDKVAIYWEGEKGEERSVTYLDLYKEVCKFANILKSLGCKKGDRVAIFMPQIPETIAAILACSRIGAVHMVIFGGIGIDGVRDRITHSGASILITVDGGFRKNKIVPYKETADVAIENTPIQNVIVVKRAAIPVQMKKGRDHYYHTLRDTVPEHCPPEVMDAEDLLFILYTSGSTGKPKGIFHTTGGYLTGVYASFQWIFDIKPKDVYWCTADPGWITGHNYVVHAPLMHGTTQIIYEGAFDAPDSSRVWKIIEKYKVSLFYTAPTAIRTFIKWGDEWPKTCDLSSLRLLGSIGEPINPDVWLWYRKHIGHDRCPIVDTWFQTETGAITIAPIPGVTPLKPGSITRPLPGIQAAVLDEEGNRCSTGSLALLTPFPSMMRGCYRDEERYLSTYWAKWEGKYYYAGDAAILDEDGYLWVTGRQDEVLKVSGHRIGTAEVESSLVDHEAVAEAAVIGVPDPLTGEKIVAFLILKAGAPHQNPFALEAELKQLVARKLGTYAKPHTVLFTPDLPKTRSGKIMRRILKNLVEKKPLGDMSTLENPQVIEILNSTLYNFQQKGESKSSESA